MSIFDIPLPKRPPAVTSAPVEKPAQAKASPRPFEEQSREPTPQKPAWQRAAMPRPEVKPDRGSQANLPLRSRNTLGDALRHAGSPGFEKKESQDRGSAGSVGGGGGPSVAHVQPMVNADGIGALADTDRKAQSRDRRYDSQVDAVMESQSPNQAPAAKPQAGTLADAMAKIKAQPKPSKPDGDTTPRRRPRM